MLALGENDKIPVVSLLSADDDSSSSISRDNITTTINHHSVDELRRAILNVTSIEHSNKTGIFNPKADGLRRLGMTDKVELESSVRMIGYDQEFENNNNSNACYNAGRIITKSTVVRHSTESNYTNANIRYHCPSLWIKAHLRTRHGHSGGPVVNDAGLVIGIVSSADHEEEELCYLAPSKLLYSLLEKPRKKISNLATAQC